MNLYQYEAMHEPWGGDPESRWARTHEMPFAAIGAAFATLGTALTGGAVAGGALAIAGAALTVVATVATVVGLALTIVGAATGDQDLLKIGGIVGLAGGVASIAGGIVNASVQAGTAAAAQGTTAATATVGSGATNAAANAITPTFASQGAQVAAQVAPTVAQNAATSAITPAFQSAVGGVGAAAAPGVLNTAASSSIAPALESATTSGVGATGTNIAGSLTAPSGVGTSAQTGSYFQNLTAQNPLLELGKIGSGFLQGANDSANFEAKLDLQKQEIGINREQLEFTKLQYANQQKNANFQGQLSIAATPVSPQAATTYKNQQASQARQQGAILTGAKPITTPA